MPTTAGTRQLFAKASMSPRPRRLRNSSILIEPLGSALTRRKLSLGTSTLSVAAVVVRTRNFAFGRSRDAGIER